jgi:hypothetical protein
MKLKAVLRTVLLSTLLITPLSGFAETPVPCPSVDPVKQSWSLLDTAIIQDVLSYYVTTSAPAFSFGNRAWFIRTIMYGRDANGAIQLGQLTVKNARALLTPNAIHMIDSYGCVYYSDRAFVYAISKI